MVATNALTTTPIARRTVSPDTIRSEVIRKSIHLSVAIVPTLVNIFGVTSIFLILGLGVVVYTWAEYMRLTGKSVAVITFLTILSLRSRDRGRFVLGPVTLGLGAMIALLLYPEPAAAIAIYALAFGDSFSSLVGKLIGTIRIPLTGGKTVEGSLACFVAVAMSTMLVTGSIYVSIGVALGAALLEVLPLRDLDNVVLPAGAGLIAAQLLGLF